MGLLRKLVCVLAVLAFSGVVHARDAANTQVVVFKTATGSVNLLNGVALNAAEATRTITLDLERNWSKVALFVFHTNATATDVTIVPTGSLDGTNYASVSSRSITAGVGTVSTYSDVKTVSADDDFYLEYDVRGLKDLRFVFSGTSAGGSDTVIVQAVAIAGN